MHLKSRFIGLVLLSLASSALAAPWSTSRPDTSDFVPIEFAGFKFDNLLVAAPSVAGEYREEIERATAMRIVRNSRSTASALSYLGALSQMDTLAPAAVAKKLKSANIDGIIVIDLHGELKDEWVKKPVLDLASLGRDSVSPGYQDLPLRKRDPAKRNIYARVALFDYASKKIAWEAEIRIRVTRKRATGAHVAQYIAKQIGKRLVNRGMLGPMPNKS